MAGDVERKSTASHEHGSKLRFELYALTSDGILDIPLPLQETGKRLSVVVHGVT